MGRKIVLGIMLPLLLIGNGLNLTMLTSEQTEGYTPPVITWVQTTHDDFANGTTVNLDLTTSPGDVVLLRGDYNWVNKNTVPPVAGVTSGHSGHAMAFDSANNVIIAFGGRPYPADVSSKTWAYNFSANEWIDLNPPNAPSKRYNPYGMVFDPVNKVMVLFGGSRGTCPAGDYNDTWIYDFSSNTWTQRFPSVAPGPRGFHAMAFDSANNVVVLVGGKMTCEPYTVYAETWTYNVSANTWTNMSPSVALDGYENPMVFDSVNNVSILSTGSGTWAYNFSANTWTSMAPPNAPAGRYSHAMAYDSASRFTLLFGGYTTYFNGETWTYNFSANNWTQRFPTNAPRPRQYPGMAFDSANNVTVLYGGWTDYSGEGAPTWVFLRTYFSAGNLISQIFDAGSNVNWLNISWSQGLPAGTNLTMQTRSSVDNVTWSNWSTPLYCPTTLCNFAVASPDNTRYFQWLANFSTTDTTRTPMLSEVNVTFQYGLPVGGIWIPVDKLALLTPWIILAVAAAAITITLAYAKKRWTVKAIVQKQK